MRNNALVISTRLGQKLLTRVSPISPGTESVENVEVSSSPDHTVSVNTHEGGEMKMTVDVSGAKTQVIFDKVFSKLVAAAQPIPGFRRVKGGKTPDIPKDILLHILGPTKVHKEVILKIINSVVAAYVEKEGLKVTDDLRVEQSFEELEAKFEPGKEFSFNAIIQLQETDKDKQ